MIARRLAHGGLALVLTSVTIALSGAGAWAAEIPTGNLTQNPSLETGTTGWQAKRATLRQVALTGAPHGSYVAEVSRRQGDRYALTDSPDTVIATTVGAEYEAVTWVRAASASSVGDIAVLKIRELAPDGTVVNRTKATVVLSSSFQELSVSGTAVGDGNALDLRVLQRGAGPGDAFYTDAISLVRSDVPPEPCPQDQFHVQYFPNQYLSGEPTAADCVASVDENWGEGGPDGLPVNNFSASYEGRITFDEADYEFVGGADDGIRVYVDGELVIDEWHDQAFTTYEVTRSMTAGLHTVRVEFYDNSVDARVLLGITSLDPGDPTLHPVDGGPDFYGRFANPLPTDESFFPRAVWLPCVNDQSQVDLDKSIGLNVYVGICHEGPWSLQLARDNGMHVIPQQNEWLGDPAVGSESAGWLLWDEVDMQMPPAEGFAYMQGIVESLPEDGRFRYNNYGKGVAYWLSDADAARYVNDFQDVVSADVYWFTDNNTCGDLERSRPGVIAANDCHVGANYGWLVNRVRSLVSPAHSKPVWAFIEVGHPFTEDEWPTITGAQIRSAVWHSLIAGARGIQYFNHSFGGDCESHNVLRECSESIRAPVTALNEQIERLAPVLNAPTVEGGWVQGEGTRTMVKWHDGHFYVFMGAAGVATNGSFTLDCVGDATATVIDEDRSIPVVNGAFSDSFADADTVHIYRIDGGGTCALG